MLKINKKKIYLIEWHDALSNSGWFAGDELKKFIEEDKCICQNVGWIMSENKAEITIASRTLEHTDENLRQWGMVQKIPKAWIKKRIIFKL